jgi:hypothetical protein
MIDRGNYRARAIDHQFGFAEKGTEQIVVTFEITEEGDFRGHTIAWFGFFTEATSERTVQALRTCGWEGDELSELVGLDRNEVVLVIDHEEYNGKTQARVKWVNRLGSGRIELKKKMTDAQRGVLAKRLKGLVVATKAKAEPTPQSKPQSAPPKPRREYPADWDGQGMDGL